MLGEILMSLSRANHYRNMNPEQKELRKQQMRDYIRTKRGKLI